jgi:hypothetical protein
LLKPVSDDPADRMDELFSSFIDCYQQSTALHRQQEAMDERGDEGGDERREEQAPNNKRKEKFKEPKIKWGKSKARGLLFKDLVDRNIPSHTGTSSIVIISELRCSLFPLQKTSLRFLTRYLSKRDTLACVHHSKE